MTGGAVGMTGGAVGMTGGAVGMTGELLVDKRYQICLYVIFILKGVNMLKKMVEIIMVAIIVAGAAGAYFHWMGGLPISVTSTQKASTFDATGEGKVVVAPDQATISMGVQEQGTNLKQVQELVNQKMAGLSKSLKNLGIDDKDIKTTGYNYYPDYQDKNKYTAYANVSVTVRDLAKVSSTMDLIGTLGLDSVSGPTFGLSTELLDKTTKEARAQAIDKAKAKAEELAGLAGMHLGKIINVTEGAGARAPQPYLMAKAMPVGDSAGSTGTATPVEAGSSEVSVSVTLSYETN